MNELGLQLFKVYIKLMYTVKISLLIIKNQNSIRKKIQTIAVETSEHTDSCTSTRVCVIQSACYSIFITHTDKLGCCFVPHSLISSCLMSNLIRRLVRADKGTFPQCSNIKPQCHGPNLRSHLCSLF